MEFTKGLINGIDECIGLILELWHLIGEAGAGRFREARHAAHERVFANASIVWLGRRFRVGGECGIFSHVVDQEGDLAV